MVALYAALALLFSCSGPALAVRRPSYRDSRGCGDLEQGNLTEKVKMEMTNVMQAVRGISDELSPDSGMFKKMWYGSKLGDAQKKLLFLEKGFACLGVQSTDFLDIVVPDVRPEDYSVPPSAFPIVLELWDKRMWGKNIFIGEASLPLTPTDGLQSKKLILTANPHHAHTHDPSGAWMTVDYSVSRSEPGPCSKPEWQSEGVECTKIAVQVQCKEAGDIPKVGMTSKTHPYCRMMLKKTVDEPSARFQSEPVSDTLPTESTELDASTATFKEEWEVPLIMPHPSSVPGQEVDPNLYEPWTIDRMTIQEQLNDMVYTLATKVFLKEHTCVGNSVFKKRCQLVEWLSRFAVDSSALSDLKDAAEETKDEEVRAGVGVAVEALEDEIQEDEQAPLAPALLETQRRISSGRVGNMAAVRAGQRAARRRNGGGHGGGRHRRSSGGGDNGGLGWFCLALVIIMIVGA